jgi:Flp pilus assembly protein TadG
MKRMLDKSKARRGASAVEFALVAPILFTFLFAAIEFSRANMLVHTCKIAATEGARRGIVPGASAQKCREAAQEELDVLGIDDSKIDVQPADITKGTSDVTVTVTAPFEGRNGYVFARFFIGKRAVSSVTLRRETPDFR